MVVVVDVGRRDVVETWPENLRKMSIQSTVHLTSSITSTPIHTFTHPLPLYPKTTPNNDGFPRKCRERRYQQLHHDAVLRVSLSSSIICRAHQMFVDRVCRAGSLIYTIGGMQRVVVFTGRNTRLRVRNLEIWESQLVGYLVSDARAPSSLMGS